MVKFLHGKLIAPDIYASLYTGVDGFESVCIEARQQTNLAFLAEIQPRTILEVGCGPSLLSTMPGALELDFDTWTIVEPASRYAEIARSANADDSRFCVVQGYLEAQVDTLQRLMPEGFAAVVLSGVLNETTDPLGLLTDVARLLKPGGMVLVSVPNALSFHRLLAFECGLIPSPHELSALDIKLGHPAVFDPVILRDLLSRAGIVVRKSGGYLFKPFTNDQMQTMVDAVGHHLVDGLISLGRHFPEHAAEIFVIGQKPT